MNLKVIMLYERSQYQKSHAVLFYLYDILKKTKS